MDNKRNKEIMAANILKYMAKKGVDNQQLCADLNIAYTTFVDWIKANTYPRIGKVELLANYFGCEKSDLIEEKAEDMGAAQRGALEAMIAKDPDALDFIVKYLKLSEENKKAVRQIVDSLSI